MLVISIAALALAGCATTDQKVSPVNQVQTQVVDLQQRMEDQEKEIVDLKYEVKELSGKVDSKNTVEVETSSPTPTSSRATESKSAEGETGNIIKVEATGLEVQKALKNAGVYNGKVDGKVGPRTKNAVVEFQRQHSLKSDGVIGQKTWNVLKTYLEPAAAPAEENKAAE
jgi:peptidoglycan hydrolase-like protein with peptidoglycan-binding domain